MSQGGAGRGQDFSARPSVHLARGRAHRSTPGMRHGCRAGARDATRGSGDARSSSSAARGVWETGHHPEAAEPHRNPIRETPSAPWPGKGSEKSCGKETSCIIIS